MGLDATFPPTATSVGAPRSRTASPLQEEEGRRCARLRIAIRADVLAEIDGPMLQHGLKDLEGRRIDVPRAERLRPNRDYLAERFERFRAA